MMRSLYSAASGMRNHQLKMDVIGNNIANVNTVAFKSSQVTFQDAMYQMISAGTGPTENTGGTTPRQVGTGVALNTIDTIFTQGSYSSTSNDTDLMIQGDGFFALTDDVNVYYTRAGAFGFNSSGELINKSDGMYVLDSSGSKITIDDFSSVSTISINKSGEILADGEVRATIGLAKIPCPEGLENVGGNLYRETNISGVPVLSYAGDSESGLASTTIVSGSLEMSNVDLVQEMTNMIITQRGYQANARTVSTSDEMLQELMNLKR